MQNKRIVVIGGGISGLATAALLARANYQVTLFEKNSQLGGRAQVLTAKGFSFDMGPSWYMMPEVFEKYFSLFGKKPSDYYSLKKLDPRYRVYFGQKDYVDVDDDFNKNMQLFEKLEKGAGKKLEQLISDLKTIYPVIGDQFIYSDYTRLTDLITASNLKALAVILTKANPLLSFDQYISKRITSDKLKKILEFSTVFLGGSPYNTPAVYAMLIYADFIQKIWYPLGGMKMVVKALETLCRDNRVDLKLSEPVTKIEVVNGKSSGVTTPKGFYPADYVISSTDYAFTEINMLDRQWQNYPAKYWQKKTLAISAILIYLGIRGKVKNMLHHNLYFCPDWQKNFDQIFEEKTYPNDPSLYISIRTKSDNTIAPKDTEELFILVPLGSGMNIDNNQQSEYVDLVIDKIEKLSGESVRSRIIFRKVFAQNDFAQEYNAYQGTALGLAHTLNQSVMFRPNNKSKKVKNLYYVGQYTNPGVGVPMCLISAQIVTKLINREN